MCRIPMEQYLKLDPSSDWADIARSRLSMTDTSD
jgi:hypothetical protein